MNFHQDDIQRVLDRRHPDPFRVLGRHVDAIGGAVVRVHFPDAREVKIGTGLPMVRLGESDLFVWHGAAAEVPERYTVVWSDYSGVTHELVDPYCFPPQLSDFDLHLLAQGRHWHSYRLLGANCRVVDGVAGTLFGLWAPTAVSISVVGNFNNWDGRCHPMRSRGQSGVWELFIPQVSAGDLYKFEVCPQSGDLLPLKIDPYGRGFELRPQTASVVVDESDFHWGDASWIARRRASDWRHQPISIYEVHLGTWRRPAVETGSASFANYRDIGKQLVPYVVSMGFTHIELLPITEHPLDASWGYQTTGYFAPTSRHGTADDFRWFVDLCHARGLGVILDWVPAHFPRDEHALAQFNGSPLYEYADSRKAELRDWGTLMFNYARNEVRNFLLSSAMYWLEEFHLDGLRVDAVASMLYLDYSKGDGEWLPNHHGGRENLEAIEFLRELNTVTQGQHPGVMIIAEDSTAWPMVTKPSWVGGLGFSMKWNLGWMHDSLDYLSMDPVYRSFNHDRLTFGLTYAFSENYVLPLSHDEVVHGKGSLLGRMRGDDWQRFASLRLLFTYMWTYPGKKLLFMGGEFGQQREWDHDGFLDWHLLEDSRHSGVARLVSDLNELYRNSPALCALEFSEQGFQWIDCHDTVHSVLSLLRLGEDDIVVVALNFTPVPRFQYRIGVPQEGYYTEVFNSDSAHYGGTDVGNLGGIPATSVGWMGKPCSMEITLPPLAGVVFRWSPERTDY